MAENETPVRSIAASIVAAVTVDTPAEECARLQRHYNLTQLPVVNGGRLIGVILAESLLSATVEQDTRQMQRVASVGRARPWTAPCPPQYGRAFHGLR